MTMLLIDDSFFPLNSLTTYSLNFSNFSYYFFSS